MKIEVTREQLHTIKTLIELFTAQGENIKPLLDTVNTALEAPFD